VAVEPLSVVGAGWVAVEPLSVVGAGWVGEGLELSTCEVGTSTVAAWRSLVGWITVVPSGMRVLQLNEVSKSITIKNRIGRRMIGS
jgi:hypothetical protein